MAPRRKAPLVAGGAVLAALAGGVAFIADDIALFQLTNVLVYAIALLGLNLLVGYSGQVSQAHGAFYGAALIFVVFLLPAGIAGLARRAAR